ncbi:MAG: hypothetical protein WA705_11860 [Candidatus Ozemobacteraceae bacterium]
MRQSPKKMTESSRRKPGEQNPNRPVFRWVWNGARKEDSVPKTAARVDAGVDVGVDVRAGVGVGVGVGVGSGLQKEPANCIRNSSLRSFAQILYHKTMWTILKSTFYNATGSSENKPDICLFWMYQSTTALHAFFILSFLVILFHP